MRERILKIDTKSPPRVRLKYINVLLILLLCQLCSCNRAPRFLIDGRSEIVIRLKEGPDTPVEAISSNEANIYLVKELDREVRDEYSFVLTLTDGHLGEGNFITQSFLLLVEDINDNEPIFKPYPSALTVKEDASPGILATVEATDLDEGAYGQVLYNLQELDGDIDNFSIQTVGGKGVIRLINTLDYERKPLYQLRVLAVDRANQGQINTGTAAIIVKVQDVEDQPPEFVVATPVTRISEDAPVGTSVLQVRAIDGDRGINNRISYSIISGGEDNFDIDSSSGVIFTVSSLDREDPNNSNGAYILEILVTIIVTDVNDETPSFRSGRYVGEVIENAQQNTPITFLQDAIPEVFDYDQGKNGTFELYLVGDNGVFDVTPFKGINEASVVPITVHIKDENDNFPEFTQPSYTVSIPENCGVGTTVAWVQALDQDSDNYGTRGIRYTNLSGSIAHLLHLNPISGVITVKHAGSDSFDRELVSQHYITVEARDDLGKGNRNTVQLVINIEDVNDNAPMFLVNKYEARLHIEYAIVMGDYKNNFTIDPNLGIITPSSGLDFEQIPARDFGTPSLSSTVSVTIYVQDVNDHAPMFQQMMYRRAIPEDMPPGTSVLEVKARDVDGSSPNNRIVYRIQRGASDKFVIDSHTGLVSVANGSSLDPDKTDPKHTVYTLTVVALDGGIGEQQLSAAVLVNITIVDVNNKPPVLMEPGTVHVMENTQPVLRYAIDRASSFARDEDGVIVPATEYDYLSMWDLNTVDGTLRIDMAAIEGGPQQTSSATLTVVVLDQNDNNPKFRKPFYKTSVPENSKNGAHIETLVADDADKNRTMTYVLEGTEELLELVHIDKSSGQMVVSNRIDHEMYPWINLTCKAIDSGVPPRYSVVLDENDNNPIFESNTFEYRVKEDTDPGTVVANIRATDLDSGEYGKITYLLDRVSTQGKFLINAETGALTVSEGLDRETQATYNLVVEAWDNYQFGTEELLELVHIDKSSGQMVVSNRIDHEMYPWINLTCKAIDSGVPPRYSVVLDENDNNPIFESNTFEYRVKEDTDPGTVVANIRATDLDSGEYGKITYLLDRVSTQGKFLINAETGALTVSEGLDRETQATYNLVVEAWDNYQFGFLNGESRNAFKQIVSVPYRASGWRRQQRAPVRARLAPGPLRELLAGGGGARPGAACARGAGPAAALRIEAYDLGLPTPLSSDLDLTVYVQNVDNYRPRFPQRHIMLNITENMSNYSTVLPNVVEKDEIDRGDEPMLPICYYIVDGDGDSMFELDRGSHRLSSKPLDREQKSNYSLTVLATEDCLMKPKYDVKKDAISALTVHVRVDDVNDNGPKFVSKIFTGGITTEADFGIEFMHVMAIDNDEGDNARVGYHLGGQVKQTLTEGLENLAVSPFLVNEETGAVALNFDPQKGMKGYFDFKGRLRRPHQDRPVPAPGERTRPLRAGGGPGAAAGGQEHRAAGRLVQSGRVPNTNKHSTKGSNPIWLHAYENDWYKADEQSHSERDSLDNNAVNQDISNEKPYFITAAAFPSIHSTETETESNTGNYDFYQQLEQMKNAKNMETTDQLRDNLLYVIVVIEQTWMLLIDDYEIIYDSQKVKILEHNII
ncbi:unnamed protein product [Leptidea sinapis]|uniref:Cadherin domain-containing protein n=1 Tax=Leptidea sinapis TaxID=189913 RepID=A0A5E4QGN7_9NEOP|nr:unnamed protein product [Leptidea sinapis]